MKLSNTGRELQTLLEAIKASEVVENRVQLLKELEGLDISEKDEVNTLLECLTIFWEDFTCLDISQCMLNKTILQVAAKYLESEISGCLVQFLLLGTKANIWCRKHLKMTLMSIEDSPEEEHCSFFYQLVLDLLNYSAASYSALARYPVSVNNELVVSLENFISEQFTLMKDFVSEIKSIQIISVELLEAALVALEAVTRLCKVYCNGVKWDMFHKQMDVEKISDCKETENRDHVIQVTNCTIEKLCGLGTVAANGGGSLASLLNLSWKNVVSLLQFGKGALAEKVNITGIIKNLISLATESLRCASDTWSSPMVKTIHTTEARRIFLPVKFYLINAVRIISRYQTQALSVYKEIALCVVTILAFRISLSAVEHLKPASEAVVEILEPTSLHLLNSLLNSTQVKQENKSRILDWLFSNNGIDMTSEAKNSFDVIISSNSDSVNKDKMLVLGRVALILKLLTCAADLEEDIRLGIARKLGWLLDILMDEDVYCSLLVLQVPSESTSSQNHESTYQPLFCAVPHALKTFIIVVSSSPVWNEVELFLTENLFHPHFLCLDIITELWCFILRHAELDFVNAIVDKLCTLLMLSSRESVLFPQSALRKTARLICDIVTHGPEFIVDRVYSCVFDGSKPEYELNVHLALLMEGFPLNFLSEKKRSNAKQRIITQYYEFLESFEDISTRESDSRVYGAPVFALSAALQSLQVSLSDTDMKTLKFLMSIIDNYKTSSDKDNYRRLLNEVLGIVSNMKHLYSFNEMEKVILELQSLFISKPALSDNQLFTCKSNLAYFMAGLSHVKFPESDNSPRNAAAWELYHVLLRERHWALIHLSITAFGYFASMTSCNQLWRFVPQDAALSFDLESGKEADEERFMSELRAVLEKEFETSPDQLAMLAREGQVLKENVRRDPEEYGLSDMMDIEEEKQQQQPSKKRKFPDGISRGVELLRDGLKVMVDGFSDWQKNQHGTSEVREEFRAHFSRLEDVIGHLVSLSDS